ncbi:MAG: hypothetical protein U0R23_06115 [Candidatus Nanopelagicales bacterium]
MKKSTALAAALAVPLLGAAAVAPAAAATDPSEVVIPALDAEYLGPLSSAGKTPKVQVDAQEVSRAFVNMTTYKSVSKVVKATDGEATKKGTIVKAEGYRCKATSYKVVNPGTAGMYAKVKWKCTFQAADTPTTITLTYKQSSL